jgi:hypothetical protein
MVSSAFVHAAAEERVVNHRHLVFVVLHMHLHGQTELAQIAQARRRTATLLRPDHDRQQQCRENGDDGNDHEQFDESEGEAVMVES